MTGGKLTIHTMYMYLALGFAEVDPGRLLYPANLVFGRNIEPDRQYRIWGPHPCIEQ